MSVTGLRSPALSQSRLTENFPCEFCEFCPLRHFTGYKTVVEMFCFEFYEFFEVTTSLQMELTQGYFLMNFLNFFSMQLYRNRNFDTGAFL